MKLSTVRGTRDYLPEDQLIRERVISVLKTYFARYGFNPLDTPGIELLDVLTAKFTGGEEILKEMYTLKDNADRDLGLRYDLTVPFGRVVAMNKDLCRPFKRYAIGKVWRNGPIKLGRYREFTQCDVDIAGAKSLLFDAELLKLAEDVFAELDLQSVTRLNSVKLLRGMARKAGFADEDFVSVMLSVDKLTKIGKEGVAKELTEKGFADDAINAILSMVTQPCKTNEETLAYLEKEFAEDSQDLREVYLSAVKLGAKNIQLSLCLSRGLAYYTGTILEFYLKDTSKISSSIGSGGRYDNMIGAYLGCEEKVPAVGISFGLDIIMDAIKTQQSVVRKSCVQILLSPMRNEEQCLNLLSELRSSGINVEMDFLGRNISKNLRYADAQKIPYVLIAGENEFSSGAFTLKNMLSGEEKKLSVEGIVQEVKEQS